MIFLAMDRSKLGNILGTAGIVAGIVYGMRTKKGFGKTAMFCGLFAVAGVLIGNSVTKFYE